MKRLGMWLKEKIGILGVFVLLGISCGAGFAGCAVYPEPELVTESEENTGSVKNLWDLFTGSGTSTQSSEQDAFLQKINDLKTLIDVYYWEEAEQETLYDGIYHGMLWSLGDPYSCYYSPEEYAALMEEIEGTYCGIGALVSQNASTKVITIVRPFVDGPAYKAGMLPGDILTKIDGEDVSSWDIDLAVKHMKGEQGTVVEVEVWRSSIGEYVDLTITRDVVKVETVTYQMLEDSIGYIYIMQFDDKEVTTKPFEQALMSLKEQGMKGLVVDIRDNGGGLLTTVCDMLDLFLEEDDLIVYTVDKYENKEEIFAKKGSIGEIPMVILVNGYSASASEIFSGALQDYGLAKIVGTQSFGKGIVQSVIPLDDGSAIKLTVSTYYTPAGRNIHGTGITPDVVVELDEELRQKPVVALSEDNQVQRAIEEVKKMMK